MKNKVNWFEAFLVITPFVLLAVFWNQIPPRIPLQWTLDGQIGRWGSKTFGLLNLPLASLATVVILHFVPRFDPKLQGKQNSADRMSAVLPIFRILIASFFLVVFLLLFCAALGIYVSTGRILMTAILLLLAGMGNFLGILRPNYFIGLRTPWTATHRVGGRLLFFGSTALLVAEFFVGEHVFFFLFITGTLLLVVWSFVYSWHHFRTCSVAERTSSST